METSLIYLIVFSSALLCGVIVGGTLIWSPESGSRDTKNPGAIMAQQTPIASNEVTLATATQNDLAIQINDVATRLEEAQEDIAFLKSQVTNEGDWKTFTSSKYGFTISYPSDFTRFTFDPIGKISLSAPAAAETPIFTVEINTGGRGWSGHDFEYVIEQTDDGTLTIIETQVLQEEPMDADGSVVIGASFTGSDGQHYTFWHDYRTGGKNWEPILRKMTESVRIAVPNE